MDSDSYLQVVEAEGDLLVALRLAMVAAFVALEHLADIVVILESSGDDDDGERMPDAA